MFCKKCGTEQRDGQKFCPNCGEPYLDENGKPYEKGFIKDLKDARDNIVSKAEEISQQGQRLIDEKIQPQLNEKVKELKNTDWSEKKEKLVSYLRQFLHNTEKIDKIKKVVVCLFVLYFFAKAGFSAPILWYVIMAALVYIAFKGIPKLDLDASKSNYLSLLACGFIMVVTTMTFFQNGGISNKESLQKEFLKSIDDPSTAYAVRINMAFYGGGAGAGIIEVPESKAEKSSTYIWTLIFFPKDETKTVGRAVIEPWATHKDVWAKGLSTAYNYMIRDGVVELYSGISLSAWAGSQIKNIDPGRPFDKRFFIEKENGELQLKGNLRGKERVLKKTTYRDVANKQNHYR